MLSEKAKLKAKLYLEFKNLNFYIKRAITFKNQKNFERFLIINYIIINIKEKIHQYQLEIEILGEKGRLG